MNLSIILVGSGALIVLGVLAGLARIVDDRANGEAWRGVAAQRRANWEERQRMDSLLGALLQEAEGCPCRVCRRLRRLFGPGNHPRNPT